MFRFGSFDIGSFLVSSSSPTKISIHFLLTLNGCCYVRSDPGKVIVITLNDPVWNVRSQCGVDGRSKYLSHFLRTKGIKPGMPIYSLKVMVDSLRVFLRVIPYSPLVMWWRGYRNVYFAIHYLMLTVLICFIRRTYSC